MIIVFMNRYIYIFPVVRQVRAARLMVQINLYREVTRRVSSDQHLYADYYYYFIFLF